MYCTVYTTGDGHVIYINPNCNIKMIYEYLRVVTDLPDSKEIDLCTESGRLLGIYEAPCTASGLLYFTPRASYFVLTFDYVEGSGELSNPQTMMEYKNPDFAAVFTKIKKEFGILPTEVIDDQDALLIFEHLLMAYQGNLQQISETNASLKKSPIRKKRVQSFTHNSRSSLRSKTSSKSRASKHFHDKNLENSVLAQWREEKQAKLAATMAEESEEIARDRNSLGRSVVENVFTTEGSHVATKSMSEERNFKKAKDPDTHNPARHIKERKASKKSSRRIDKEDIQLQKAASDKSKALLNSKKTNKEDTQLQQAAPNKAKASLTSKPSARSLTQSVLQLHPPENVGSYDELKTSWKSKSSFAPTSKDCNPPKPTHSLPQNSIRQFFRDQANGLSSLPKPPAENLSPQVSEKLKKVRRKKKGAGLGTKKIVASRSSLTINRKRPRK